MSFEWPWILLLLPLPLWFLRRTASDQSREAPPLPPRLLAAMSTLGASSRRPPRLQTLLSWCCWCLLLVAIAQPIRPGDTRVQPASGRAMMLAVDLSASMERADFSLDGQPANRLAVVRRLAADFLRERQGDRVGLVLFGKEAFLASPPTFDIDAVISALNSAGIGMAGRSTAIGDALGMSLRSLQHDTASRKAIVLLSDGTNNAGSVEPEMAAELAAELSVVVHTIALASEEDASIGGIQGLQAARAADLDEEALEAIAEQSGGRFFRARSSDELAAIYAQIDQLTRSEAPAPPIVVKRYLGIFPILALLLILLLWAGHGRSLAVSADHS